MNNEVSVYTFITLLYFKILVKSLIKSKWRYGRISTRYNVLQDVKLPFRYQAVVAGVVVVVSVTTEDSLISTSLVKLYY